MFTIFSAVDKLWYMFKDRIHEGYPIEYYNIILTKFYILFYTIELQFYI